MSQIIAVRFINPQNNGIIHECYTMASSHEEAIRLAMTDFSQGVGTIKRIDRLTAEKFFPAGNMSSWRSTYSCTVEDDEYDRELYAILDASYPDRSPDRKESNAQLSDR